MEQVPPHFSCHQVFVHFLKQFSVSFCFSSFFALSHHSSLLSFLKPRLPSGGLASSFLTSSPSLFLVLMLKERQKLNNKVNRLRAYVTLSVTLIEDALTTELGGGFSPSNVNLCVLVISSSCYSSSTLADQHETSIKPKTINL